MTYLLTRSIFVLVVTLTLSGVAYSQNAAMVLSNSDTSTNINCRRVSDVFKHRGSFSITEQKVGGNFSNIYAGWSNRLNDHHYIVYYHGELSINADQTDVHLGFDQKQDSLSSILTPLNRGHVTVLLDIHTRGDVGVIRRALKTAFQAKCSNLAERDGHELTLLAAVDNSERPASDQSHFNYWLVDGFRSLAGEPWETSENTQALKIGELFYHISANMSKVPDLPKTALPFMLCSGGRGEFTQTNAKQAILLTTDIGPQVPASLDLAIDTLATSIQHQVEAANLDTIVFPGITAKERNGGVLCRNIETRLRRKLNKIGVAAADHVVLNAHLNNQGITPENLNQKIGDIGKLTIQGLQGNTQVAFLHGTLQITGVGRVLIKIDVVDLANERIMRRASASATLSPPELDLMGESRLDAVRIEQFKQKKQIDRESAESVKQRRAAQKRNVQETPEFYTISTIDENVRKTKKQSDSTPETHPLATDNTFRIQLRNMTTGKMSKVEFTTPPRQVTRGGRTESARQLIAYTELKKCDIYRIIIFNGSGKGVFLRLLVDGQNTLPEIVGNKSYQARHVMLDEARPWFCAADLTESTVAGFYSSTADANGNATYNEFKVTDATTSLAASKGFPTDVGVITAAFYEPVIRRKDLAAGPSNAGTVMGDQRTAKLKAYTDDAIPHPDPLVVLHLRYGLAQ